MTRCDHGVTSTSFLGGCDISPDLLVGDATTNEKDLSVAFKNGEKGAYQAIHDTYAARVYGVCRRMLLHHEDAEEATQETFLRVYQALTRFNGQYQLGAWITRIATNVCLDQLRSRARKPQCAEASVELMELTAAEGAVADDPQDVVIRHSESRHVRRVLRSLPPLHRAAIVLRDFEGLSYDDIAKVLEITDGQVKALIHRARQNFKKSWAREIASALAPIGLIDRLRKLSMFGKETAANTSTRVAEAATPALQGAASCSSFVQHCGQAFAERVAPVAMAFMVGGAGTVGAAALASEEGPEPRPAADSAVAPQEMTRPTTSQDERKPKKPPVVAPAEPVTEAPPTTKEEKPSETTAEPPPPQPNPPGPQPTQPPPGSNGGSGTTTAPLVPAPPAPAPTPTEPAGFSLAIATGWSLEGGICPACAQPTAVVSQWVNGDGAGLRAFSHAVTGTAANAGAGSFAARISHSTYDMDHHQITAVLRTGQGTYDYRGIGHLTATRATAWGGFVYTFEGTYGLASRPCRCEPMPQSGSYRVEAVFSPKQQRFTSTNVSL